MNLKWSDEFHEAQPFGFMNFPKSDGIKYKRDNFFSHFQSEEKVFEKNGAFRWKKRSGTQNHMYDCRLYALVARDVLFDIIMSQVKIKNPTWSDFITVLKKSMKS